jgi:hypothetical protein
LNPEPKKEGNMTDEMNEWVGGNEEAPAKKYTIQEFEAMCEKIAAQRAVVAEHEELLEEQKQICKKLEAEAMQALESEGLKSYKGKKGAVTQEVRLSVKIPQSDEDRESFFNYLRERDIYNAMISVNSTTLNSWYAKEFELAKDAGRGLGFKVPGIGEPTYTKKLKFSKGK